MDFDLDFCYKSLQDTELIELGSDQYLMKRPGTMICSVYLSQLPGTFFTIYGDFAPNYPGVVSNRGYSLAWFAGATSLDYCSEKLLRQGFYPALAIKIGKERLQSEENLSENEQDFWKFLAGSELDLTVSEIYDVATEFDVYYLVEGGCPGHGYDPVEQLKLGAIQKRFRELWLEKLDLEEKSNNGQ